MAEAAAQEPKVYLAAHGQTPSQVAQQEFPVEGPFLGITYDSLEYVLNWQYRECLSALYGCRRRDDEEELPKNEVYELKFARWARKEDQIVPEWVDVEPDEHGNRNELILRDEVDSDVFIHVQIVNVLRRAE